MKYTPDDIARYLAIVWHGSLVVEENDPRPPDPDMPRSQSKDPHSLEKLWATKADLSKAWRYAEMTVAERRVAFMRYALDLPMTFISKEVDASERTAYNMNDRALLSMAQYLNKEFN